MLTISYGCKIVSRRIIILFIISFQFVLFDLGPILCPICLPLYILPYICAGKRGHKYNLQNALLLLFLQTQSWLCELSALPAVVEILLHDRSAYADTGLRRCTFVFARWRQRRLSGKSARRFLCAVLGVLLQHRVRIVESSSDLCVVRGGLPDVRVLVLRASGSGARLVQAVAAVATRVAAAASEPRVDRVLLWGWMQQIDRCGAELMGIWLATSIRSKRPQTLSPALSTKQTTK